MQSNICKRWTLAKLKSTNQCLSSKPPTVLVQAGYKSISPGLLVPGSLHSATLGQLRSGTRSNCIAASEGSDHLNNTENPHTVRILSRVIILVWRGQCMFPPVLCVACADILIVTAVSYDPGSANTSPSTSQHHTPGPASPLPTDPTLPTLHPGVAL